ncbi:uncharacterized protein PV09_01101 [Verruconis gallopava]|uniref:ATP-grasp domain-containing protein n=1 Tax=Verruconis gallopava TaxID=253628 RepID=A0A0D2ANR6_9PEZI|nr:uncharacterized protein PV09_01101 [Verruconis gallopava]KIW08170.1 hypothetical protein PV09_01101 [Verruconis gallopava]
MVQSSLMPSVASTRRVLFLTAEPSDEGNAKVLQDPVAVRLQQCGVEVSARSILEWDQPVNLKAYSHILFLRLWDYHLHLSRVGSLVSELRSLSGQTRIYNPLTVVLWNMDKAKYLPELQTAGIPVIETTYLPLPAPATAINHVLQLRKSKTPVVLKPSISASSFSTYLIRDAQTLSEADEAAISSFNDIKGLGDDAKLMIQEYVPEITTSGELSIVMVDGVISHAVRKIPRKDDFRSQAELGGAEEFLQADQVNENASRIAKRIWRHVDRKLERSGDDPPLYARIDGVIRDDGAFVLMEAEFIEPWMYMDAPVAKQGLEILCEQIMRRRLGPRPA